MAWELTLVVYALVIAALLLGGVWIGTVMGLTGLVGLTLLGGTRQWNSIGDILWNTTNSFELVAIPLFVLMGDLVLRSGITGPFYVGVSHWVKRIPGGLAHSNIAGCAMFAAISGSSTATALTVGTVALPELRSRGYDERLILGSLAAGGCLGILIPPSIPLIVYGAIVQESIIKLFMAGILPGLVVTALFMLYIYVRAILDPSLTPRERQQASWARVFKDQLGCLPILGLLLTVIGSMYFGIATPTEAAACGCLGALVLGLAFGKLTLPMLRQSLVTAVATSCVVMFITVNAQILTFALVNVGIAKGVANFLVGSGLSPWQFIVVLCLIYLVMGCFIDGISMMFLTVPILYPSLQALNINGIWFGIMLVIMIEIGQITPPMGLNLFAIQSISGGKSLADVASGALPFTVLLGLSIVVIYFFPEIVLYLPQSMKTK